MQFNTGCDILWVKKGTVIKLKPANTLRYRNYTCQVSYSNVKDCLTGRVLGVGQIPTVTAQTVAGIKEAFHRAVDDYITVCQETGKEPVKAFTGMYTLRFNPAVQEALTVYALAHDTTLAQVMQKALDEFIEKYGVPMPGEDEEEL